MKFINGSGLYFNTIHSTDYNFYEEVNKVIQEEPADSVDPEILGQLAAIGIVKGKPFAPDARMRKILTDAVAVGNATARSQSFKGRDPQMYFYPGKSWFTPFVGRSHEFIQNNVRLLDARTVSFHMATGITPAMAVKIVGGGSQYAGATFDGDGDYLDGGNNYRLYLPPKVPVKNFWSIIPYDTQTRSVLQTDQRDTALTSDSGTVQSNADGSVDNAPEATSTVLTSPPQNDSAGTQPRVHESPHTAPPAAPPSTMLTGPSTMLTGPSTMLTGASTGAEDRTAGLAHTDVEIAPRVHRVLRAHREHPGLVDRPARLVVAQHVQEVRR